MYMIFSVTLSAVMGVSTITPAFPNMVRAFEVSNEQIGWLITAYTLPGIIFTLFLGIIADRFGRKRVLVPSLLLFGLAGFACAFTTSFTQMVVLRFIQGIGGASLGSLNVTLIGDLYEKHTRAKAMGYNSTVLSTGTALYPSIGGALALFGWHYPFYLFLTAIPIGLMVMLMLDNPKPENNKSMVTYLRRVASILNNKEVVGLFSVNFMTFILLYGAYLTYFPILLDERFSVSSFIIGLMLSASSIVTGITSSQIGALTRRFSEVSLIRAGALIYMLSFILFPLAPSLYWLPIPIILFGLAQGINLPSVLTLLTQLSPMEYRAAFLSVNWMVVRAGQALGPVMLGLIYGIWHLNGTFIAAVITALLMFLIILITVPKSLNSNSKPSSPHE